MGSIAVRPARAEDAPALARVLAAAFAEDAVFAWCLRRHGRAAAIEAFFDAVLTEAIPTGSVMTVDGLRACAVWTPPSDQPPEGPRLTRWSDLLWLLSLAGPFRLHRLRRLFDAIAAARPETRHHGLAFLAVDPAEQRSGLGAALLGHTLRGLDRDGDAAYLETVDRRNVPYYTRHGFARTGSYHMPHGGPEIHQMWREPAGS